MPGMNPRKMKQMMKQLGMQMDPIEDVEEIVNKNSERTVYLLICRGSHHESPGCHHLPDNR